MRKIRNEFEAAHSTFLVKVLLISVAGDAFQNIKEKINKKRSSLEVRVFRKR